mmetsp:Transcript_81749/g.182454  ORF Transcript_81749/g.182454 Transcript_81749/m.182454 type:complete len:265 (-) Transcript_81749:110-904(-)
MGPGRRWGGVKNAAAGVTTAAACGGPARPAVAARPGFAFRSMGAEWLRPLVTKRWRCGQLTPTPPAQPCRNTPASSAMRFPSKVAASGPLLRPLFRRWLSCSETSCRATKPPSSKSRRRRCSDWRKPSSTSRSSVSRSKAWRRHSAASTRAASRSALRRAGTGPSAAATSQHPISLRAPLSCSSTSARAACCSWSSTFRRPTSASWRSCRSRSLPKAAICSESISCNCSTCEIRARASASWRASQASSSLRQATSRASSMAQGR